MLRTIIHPSGSKPLSREQLASCINEMEEMYPNDFLLTCGLSGSFLLLAYQQGVFEKNVNAMVSSQLIEKLRARGSTLNIDDLLSNFKDVTVLTRYATEMRQMSAKEFFQYCDGDDIFLAIAIHFHAFRQQSKKIPNNERLVAQMIITQSLKEIVKNFKEKVDKESDVAAYQMELNFFKDLFDKNSVIMKFFQRCNLQDKQKNLLLEIRKYLFNIMLKDEEQFIDVLKLCDVSLLFSSHAFDANIAFSRANVEPSYSLLSLFKRLLILAIEYPEIAAGLVLNNGVKQKVQTPDGRRWFHCLDAPLKKILLTVELAEKYYQQSGNNNISPYASIPRLMQHIRRLIAQLIFTHEKLIPESIELLDFYSNKQQFSGGIARNVIDDAIAVYSKQAKNTKPIAFYIMAKYFKVMSCCFADESKTYQQQLSTSEKKQSHDKTNLDIPKELPKDFKLLQYDENYKKFLRYRFNYFSYLLRAVNCRNPQAFFQFITNINSAFDVCIRLNADLNLEIFILFYRTLLRISKDHMPNSRFTLESNIAKIHGEQNGLYKKALEVLAKLLLEGFPKLVSEELLKLNKIRIQYLRALLPIYDILRNLGDEYYSRVFDHHVVELYGLENTVDKDEFETMQHQLTGTQRRSVEFNYYSGYISKANGLFLAIELVASQQDDEPEQGPARGFAKH